MQDRRKPENAALRKRIDEIVTGAQESTKMMRRRMTRLLTAFVLLLFGLLAYVFAQSYEGRRDLVSKERTNCAAMLADRYAVIARERDGKGIDRDLARFAKRAAEARRASGDVAVAADYDAIAKRARARLPRRSKRIAAIRARLIPCAEVFPQASPFPWLSTVVR